MEKLSSLLNVKVELLENELQKLNTINPYIKQYGASQKDEIETLNSLKSREDILSEKVLATYLQNQDILKELIIKNEIYFPIQYSNILKLIKNNTLNSVLNTKEAVNTDLEVNENDLNLLNYL